MMTLIGDENEERRKNVDELISSATFFEEKHEESTATLSAFLEEIALVTDVDNYDKSADSVVMMTVHAAKGLEFPIVFLVGMEENLFPSPQSSGTEEDLEEERRLAYVAMTRAKEQLFITCCHTRTIYGKTNSNDISRFIREIPEEHIQINLFQQKVQKYSLEERFGYKPSTVYKVPGFDRKPAVPQPSKVSKPSAATSKPQIFAAGDRVKHSIFGVGTIISAKTYASDTLYEINFDKAGKKKLMATYAKLSPAK
jgi:DNA helicase-2/ATP-dependent DNA helicase PcrA